MLFIVIVLLYGICDNLSKMNKNQSEEEDFSDFDKPIQAPFKQRLKEGWDEFKKDLKKDPYKW
jgi:hypothetical protein